MLTPEKAQASCQFTAPRERKESMFGRPLLALGAKGYYVTEMHQMLAKKLEEIEPENWDVEGLDTKDKFDAKTEKLVRAYQGEAMLVVDGMVGPKTWAALMNWELFNAYDDPDYYVPAPSKYHCWASAIAMMKNVSFTNIYDQPSGVTFETLDDGSVGGLGNGHPNMAAFAKHHRLNMITEPAINCLVLCYLVRMCGRVMLNVKGVKPGFAAGTADDSHLVVLTGVRGSGMAGGTTFRIFNPSTRSDDQRKVNGYQYLSSKYPGITYQAFTRQSGGSSKPLP
jgi:hypothetical protein